MRGFIKLLVAFVVVAGLFSYLVLPGLVESQLAGLLQTQLGLATEPEVEISSDFPPEMLLGRVDRIEATTDEVSQQGIIFSNARVDLEGLQVSVLSLLQGDVQVESESCSLTAEAPPLYLDCSGYLNGGYLG